jgi:nucleotide-binding universal stress UspA family protein
MTPHSGPRSANLTLGKATAMQDDPLNRWTHPSVILVATDLSDLDRLMPYAMNQASLSGARLILLHVVAATEALTADMAGMPYYDPGAIEESAGRILEFCCQAVRKHTIVCDGLVRDGNPSQQILEAAREFRADRIVLGTRSRSKLSKLLLGSVAEQVLRSANIPVLTVGPEARLPVDASTADRVVLHATTLREASRPSAALACQIAALLNARLVILHVLPPANGAPHPQPSILDSAAGNELHALAAATSEGSLVCVEPRIVHGHPAIEILAESEHRHATLVVMGSTARSGFQNLTRDRTVYKVLAHAHCPVLTLREEQVKAEILAPPQLAARS